jgi:uncharacterized membrane protein
LNDYVYDLGLSMERGWLVIHYNWTLLEFVKYFSGAGLVVVLSPIFELGNYPVILFLQTVLIGAAAFPIYLISNILIKKKSTSFVISMSYLIYPGIIGINWFDFHFQSFFIFLYLMGYLFYLRGKFTYSVIFFILSGMVRFPYSIFSIIFAVTEIFIIIAYKKNELYSKARISSLFILVIVSFFLFLLGWYLLGGIGGIVSTVSDNSLLIKGPTYFLNYKLLAVLFLFGPVLFLPFLSKRWVLFLVPMLYLIFFSNSFGYYYPYIIQHQYTAMVVPFVFLGSIDTISQKRWMESLSKLVKSLRFRRFAKTSTVIIAITSLLFAAYAEPYSPFNKYSTDNYQLSSSIEVNWTEFDAVKQAVALIPDNCSAVLVQNNLPMAFPRPIIYYGWNALVPGINVFSSPLNYVEIVDNSFIMKNVNDTTFVTKIDYVLADLYSPQSDLHNSKIVSMKTIVENFTNSKFYGILAELSGIILLERNYSGSPVVYNPINKFVSAGEFDVSNLSSYSHGIISTRNVIGSVWFGPYMTLPPGIFEIKFLFSTTNNQVQNRAYLDVTTNYGQNVLNSTVIHGNLLQVNKLSYVSMIFTLNYFSTSVEYRNIFSSWNGTLYYYGAQVVQLSFLH